MSYSFEYIDILLLAMIAAFIFLRLRGILGRRTENDKNFINPSQNPLSKEKYENPTLKKGKQNFDDEEKKKFIVGASLAYETIITSFAKGNLNELKPLLDKKIFTDFSEAIKTRRNKNLTSETTFIGVKSANIKDVKEINNFYNVTVDFISELITCTKNNENKIISGDPNKIKIVTDTWKFSKDKRNNNPNWLLIET
jgi:predicted lipid-binding transport protein (Tim44 family)